MQSKKRCPNCNCVMQLTRSNGFDEIADWDMDYPVRSHEEYKCRCGIECVDGEWKIPSKFLASYRQQRTMKFIEEVLGIKSPPPTKREAYKFINAYFESAREVKKRELFCLVDDGVF